MTTFEYDGGMCGPIMSLVRLSNNGVVVQRTDGARGQTHQPGAEILERIREASAVGVPRHIPHGTHGCVDFSAALRRPVAAGPYLPVVPPLARALDGCDGRLKLGLAITVFASAPREARQTRRCREAHSVRALRGENDRVGCRCRQWHAETARAGGAVPRVDADAKAAQRPAGLRGIRVAQRILALESSSRCRSDHNG
jgi:hypothetical protein